MTTSRNGTIIDADRRSAKTRKGWVRWTKRMKAEFLDHLAATCNVKASAAAIGVDPGSVYALRRRDDAFYLAWEQAVVAGYQMLETQLIGHCLAGGGATIEDGAEGFGPIDRDTALRLLSAHRTGREKVLRGGPRPQVARPDDTDAAILRKLKALPDIAANALAVAFGNFKAGYLIAERAETQILRDPYSNKPFVSFYATKRIGGCVANSEAIKVLKFSAS